MEISSNTMSISGMFKNSGVWSDRPVYWSQTHNLFLYFLPLRVGGLWTIGPHIGELGLLGHLGLDDCPEGLESSSWKYRVGSSWFLDQNIKMNCLDQQKDMSLEIQEIKGKFTMKTMTLDNKIEDTNSEEFKQLSNKIESGIKNMLDEEENLDETLEIKVSVEEVKVDNGEVDFKILYNMKDSFLAVPFELKPVNMTDILHKDFKLRKGILFEQFPVDSGSFECSSSSSTDPCSILGCSHKCGFDYDQQNYICTCPDHLQLDVSGTTCLGDDESSSDNIDTSTDPNTTQRSVTMTTSSNDVKMTTTQNRISTTQDDVTEQATENDLITTSSSDHDISTESSTTPHYHHHIKIIHEYDGDSDDKYHPHIHAPPQSNQNNFKGIDDAMKDISQNNRNKSQDDQVMNENDATTEISFTTTISEEISQTMRNDVMKPKEQGQEKNATFPFLLPIFINKFQPHHHHDTTRTLINYHGKAPTRPDHSNVVDVMTLDDDEDENDVNIVRLGDQDMEMMKMKDKDVNIVRFGDQDMEKMKESSEEGESVFMFDCIKAYNDSVEKKRSQEVLKCKMTDKGEGEDVFIVVDKSVLDAKP